MLNDFAEKLDVRLRAHLGNIDLEALSRVDSAALNSCALPNIGKIELVDSQDFAKYYDSMYIRMFPDRAERENSDLIIERLAMQSAGRRTDAAPYRIVGIRDTSGHAIGAAHFSVLPLAGCGFTVPYLQYIYVRPENRRQHMSEILHTMVLGVATTDAAVDNKIIPFTMFEAEWPGFGHEINKEYSQTRIKIHSKSGGLALLLVRGTDGKALSAHVQPGLVHGDPPLTLIWVVRPSPSLSTEYDIQSVSRSFVEAYYQNLRAEGFPERNIRHAEEIVEERCVGSSFQLIPLNEVPGLG